jgi:nucleoside-diphosphate-sugar epimerase
VGSHLARALVDDGVDVHAVVRPGARLDRIPDLAARLVLHEDDGSPGALAPVVEEAAPDVTFHLATRFIAEHQPPDVGPIVADNVLFPARLAEALARAGRPAFVNVGTAWQHVGGEAYRPKNLYAATKQAFEDVLRHYAERTELSVVTLNLYDTYGPLDHRGKLLSALLRALETGVALEMSSGQQLIDLVHVDDVVRALRMAGERCQRTACAGEQFAVASGDALSLRAVVKLLGEVAGRPLPVRWGARADRPGEMLELWDAGPSLPGWAPQVTLAAGLRALCSESC